MSAVSLRCSIGWHDDFHDTVGTNVGTEQTPVYMMHTYLTCRRCGRRVLS